MKNRERIARVLGMLEALNGLTDSTALIDAILLLEKVLKHSTIYDNYEEEDNE